MVGSTRNIADDWEHVEDDDTFSIVSLPLSEDDTLASSRTRTNIPASSNPPDNPVAQSYQVRSHSTGSSQTDSPLHDTNSDGTNAIEGSDTHIQDVIGPHTPKAQSGAIADSGAEFDSICETTSFLVKLIPEILSDPCLYVQPRLNNSDIRAECAAIGSHLDRLEEILRVYAKHRRPGTRLSELPVGLSVWLRNLKLELLRIQTALNNPRTQSSYLTTTSQSGQVNAHLERLKSLSSNMDGLMAIIQSDYEDFHTLHMPLIVAPVDDTCKSGRRGHGRSLNSITPGNNNLAHLRRELYALKDQIVAWLNEIHSCEHHGISRSLNQNKHVASLAIGYRRIKDGLETMLSNHGSNWIDHSIAGGLTYPEFCRLNPDTIRSLILQLKDVTDDLFLERSRVQSLSYDSDLGGPFCREKMVIGETSMETLRTIEEVLISILQIR